MNTMTWRKLSETVNVRSGRERLIITVTAIIILHAGIFYGIQPQLKLMQSGATTAVQSLHAQIEKINHDLYQIITTHKINSDASTLQNIVALKKRMDQLSPELLTIADSFVAPNEMTALIKNILDENKLHITSLENTPPELIDEDKTSAINIYKHTINMEVYGSYHNQIRFLKKLEASPWKIFWEEALIRADEKGTSTLSLSIFTLNYNKEWLEL